MDALIDRMGEAVTWTKLNGSAGSFAHNGIVRQAEGGIISMYFDTVEQMALTRPVLAVICKAGTSVIANDTFTRDSVNYICVKVGIGRFGNEISSKCALMNVV
jgi:hypothetical protein